jgi:signal transduction histidine kinase
MRFIPRSLIGQMALLLGAALMIAQLINFALILNERQKLSLAQNQGPAITRFVSTAADVAQGAPEFRTLIVTDSSRRGARFSLDGQSRVQESAERDPKVESRLRASLSEAGISARDVRATSANERRPTRTGSMANVRVLILSIQQPEGTWLNGRLPTPPSDRWLAARLGAATLLLYLIVLGASMFIALRLARPLGDLARAADSFKGRALPAPVLASGPADLRRAIDAFNAMNDRIVSLLDEKDTMLGAIGHDLRTPLASLRLRVEAIKPAAERERMIATITQMAAMLDDILILARTGRARETIRSMELTSLAGALVEEYRELGQAVELLPSEPLAAMIQPNLVRRAIRNLIDNAVAYGGSGTVRIKERQGSALIAVSDGGPGLPADQLEAVVDPFYRPEGSRNRETGGSGLGLAIARAVAESHNGSLRLENGPDGGLIAMLSIPLKQTAH